MKKNLKFGTILVVCLALFAGITLLFAGCNPSGQAKPSEDGCTTIVCTNFAGYDLARALLTNYQKAGGEGKVELILLGKDGQDMHSYEPTAADIMTISRADVLVCVGAEQWLDAAISSSGNQNLIRVSMMEVCDTIEEDHDHDHGGEDCTLIGQDEHVWLSVENAIRISGAIQNGICKADEENAYVWTSCGEACNAELTALRDEYTAMMAGATRNTVVIADRYPFAYLFRDLGLGCVAAFPGCSSETSASFATQTMLIEKTRELGLSYIFVMEGSDQKVAGVVASETGAEILTLNSMQVVADRESTYIQIMKYNLEQLKKALY